LISILSFNFRLSWNSTSWFFFHLTNDLFLLVIVIIFSFKIRFIYCRCFIYYIIEWTWICFFFKTCLQRPSIGFLHYRELYPVSGKAHTTYLIKAKCAQAGPDTHVNQKKKKKLTESLNYTNITCPMFFTKKERPHPLLKKYIYEQA